MDSMFKTKIKRYEEINEKGGGEMKVAKSIALLLLLLMILVGCTEKDKAIPEEDEARIEDYFPIVENEKYIYEGTGNEFAGYDVTIDYASADKIQQRVENGGTVLARVYVIKAGKLIMTLSKGEAYYRENMLEKTDGSDEVMLMEPLTKGTAWSLKDGSERTITGTDTEVVTPLGNFTCLEIVTEGRDGTTVHYYAKDIGLVKTIFRTGGMEVTSTLKSVEKDTARNQTVRIYIPDSEGGGIYYEERVVSYRTNDDTGRILETACKEAVNEAFGQILSDDTAVNSLALDEENRVRIDFNGSLTEDMNAAADLEAIILQCIADTLGYYYHADSVLLTVDGKPYQSEHIRLEAGQTIPVKLEGIDQKGGAS